MELKLLRFEGMTEEEFSFNRTFMELKFIKFDEIAANIKF